MENKWKRMEIYIKKQLKIVESSWKRVENEQSARKHVLELRNACGGLETIESRR